MKNNKFRWCENDSDDGDGDDDHDDGDDNDVDGNHDDDDEDDDNDDDNSNKLKPGPGHGAWSLATSLTTSTKGKTDFCRVARVSYHYGRRAFNFSSLKRPMESQFHNHSRDRCLRLHPKCRLT